jgi:hypothetical protein
MTNQQIEGQAIERSVWTCVGLVAAGFTSLAFHLYNPNPNAVGWIPCSVLAGLSGVAFTGYTLYNLNYKWLKYKNKTKVSRFSQTLIDEQGRSYHVEGDTAKEIDPNKVRIQPGIRTRWVVVLMLLSSLATYSVNHGVKLPFSVKIERNH